MSTQGAQRQRRDGRTSAIQIAAAVGVAAAAVGASISQTGALLTLAVLVVVLAVAMVAISNRDARTVLTLLVVLLFLLPENYVLVGPLKSVGNPAQLVGMGALALWCAGRILGTLQATPSHPIRWAVLLYAISTLTAFAAGMNRSLTIDESAGAARALFPVIASIGVALLAVDGLKENRSAESMLQRLVWVGGAAAFIGVLEFSLDDFNYRDTMRLPGLTTTTELIDDTRSGFDRIQGAAAHPIEYAVTLAALAPLALHFTLYAKTRGQRQLSGLVLLVLLVVNPMSVARSGIVALLVGLGFYAAHLSNRARLNIAVLGIIGLGVYRAAVPGLLGTLRSLLLIGSEDPSIAGRTEDYAKIPGLTYGFEAFGRGLGTFQPLSYFYLDNQYLGSLLEGGMVAFVVLIATFVVGISVARGVRHRSREPSMRSLGQALAGSIAAFMVSAATFDELGFRQAAFTLFLLLGCAGALWSTVCDQPKHRWSGEVRSDQLRPMALE